MQALCTMAVTTLRSLLDAKALLAGPLATSPPVKKICSNKSGTPRAALKGQPTMAPSATKKTARDRRFLPVGVDVAGWSHSAAASMVVYMVKLEGRNAGISDGPSHRAKRGP